MPHQGECWNCGKSFQGRRDQKYCTPKCKNEFNNGLKSRERKYINRDFESMEKNIKIINQLLDKGPASGSIFKSDLAKWGFDFSGPFRIIRNDISLVRSYILGKYKLADLPMTYEYERIEQIPG